MTAPSPSFDEDAFHERQRDRLCSKRLMPAFEGPWVQALMQALQGRFRDRFREDSGLRDVVDCFGHVRDDQIEGLWHVLRKATQKAEPRSEAERTWLIELAVYAAIRCLNLGSPEPVVRLVGEEGPHARVESLRTRSSLIAAIAQSALQGWVIRPVPGGYPGAIDLVGLLPGSVDVVSTVVERLYADLCSPVYLAGANPTYESRLAAVQNALAERRQDGEGCTVFLVMPHLDSEQQAYVARRLARELKSHVTLGAEDHDPALAREAQTLLSTAMVVDHLNRLLSRFKADGTGPTGTRLPPREAPRPPPAPDMNWSFDIFISHASEDKAGFVEPLKQRLEALDLRVWYDEEQLDMGDSITRGISQGLATSRFVLVVISDAFLRKGWPSEELGAALSAQLSSGQKRVLPVALDLSSEDVRGRVTLLADRRYIAARRGEAEDLRKVVGEVIRAIDRAV